MLVFRGKRVQWECSTALSQRFPRLQAQRSLLTNPSLHTTKHYKSVLQVRTLRTQAYAHQTQVHPLTKHHHTNPLTRRPGHMTVGIPYVWRLGRPTRHPTTNPGSGPAYIIARLCNRVYAHYKSESYPHYRHYESERMQHYKSKSYPHSPRIQRSPDETT